MNDNPISDLIKPVPGVTVSNADISTAPLEYFHLVVIVEPDPQTWMVLPKHSDGMHEIITMHNDAIIFEFDPDEPIEPCVPHPGDLDWAQVVRLYYMEVEEGFYHILSWRTNASFCCSDYGESKTFTLYLKGLKIEYPQWRIAVIGAVFEDDVIRVANQIADLEFDVTILTRYCISSNLFMNLDTLVEYRDQYRRRLIDNGCDPSDTFFTNLLHDEDE